MDSFIILGVRTYHKLLLAKSWTLPEMEAIVSLCCQSQSPPPHDACTKVKVVVLTCVACVSPLRTCWNVTRSRGSLQKKLCSTRTLPTSAPLKHPTARPDWLVLTPACPWGLVPPKLNKPPYGFSNWPLRPIPAFILLCLSVNLNPSGSARF